MEEEEGREGRSRRVHHCRSVGCVAASATLASGMRRTLHLLDGRGRRSFWVGLSVDKGVSLMNTQSFYLATTTQYHMGGPILPKFV